MRRSLIIALVICALGTTWAQVPPTSLPPPETGPDVDLLHHLRRSTVSLGLRITENGKTRFGTVGSGVIVAWDAHHGCLLTAKHVFYDPTKGFFPTALYLRLPQAEPRAEDDLGIELPLVSNGQNLWSGAGDADLAVIGLPNLSTYKNLLKFA